MLEVGNNIFTMAEEQTLFYSVVNLEKPINYRRGIEGPFDDQQRLVASNSEEQIYYWVRLGRAWGERQP